MCLPSDGPRPGDEEKFESDSERSRLILNKRKEIIDGLRIEVMNIKIFINPNAITSPESFIKEFEGALDKAKKFVEKIGSF